MASFKEASRKDWLSDNSSEQITTGCLQRIADATELMASNYVSLQNDRDRYGESPQCNKDKRIVEWMLTGDGYKDRNDLRIVYVETAYVPQRN